MTATIEKVEHRMTNDENHEVTALYTAVPVAQQPQTEALESLLSTAVGLLMGYEDRDGKGGTRNPYKPGSVVAKFVAECAERLKDWPMTAAPQQSEPMFWVRLRSDGMYEGPIHNAQIERARVQSGAWSPLYLGALPSTQKKCTCGQWEACHICANTNPPQQAESVPPGFVIVPVEPTDLMWNTMMKWGTKRSEWREILDAAIAAQGEKP